MGSKITGKEYPLLKIFSSDFEYHIPAYQRPYAWTAEETGILFDDLYEFYRTEPTDNYFLGTIVLIKEDDKPYADVIDGQQRLTTLTILFSVLAASLTGKAREACDALLQENGNILAGIPARPRVNLRERDQDFFNEYIQRVQIQTLMNMDATVFSTEAQRHIQENCKTLSERFEGTFHGEQEKLIPFSTFLLNRCFLVAVSTDSQESAFRVFSVMNSRGLDLLPIDIIKSEIIGEIPTNKQQEYTNKWEELENETGREGFNEVFTHTRTIFAKERPKKGLLEEFREYVVKRITPQELVDNILSPYAEAYTILKNNEYVAAAQADEVNAVLQWLNKIDNYDWMPPAIKFLAERPHDTEYILWFVKKLERLASYLHVTAQDVNHRMDRYKWVLVEMDNNQNHSLEHPLVSIDLTADEKNAFKEALGGEIYTMPSRRRNYIIQRLDSFVSDGGEKVKYDMKLFTIEHVLPQHPEKGSEWDTLWPKSEERDFWVNRIANLVPLTRKHNSAAQNYDFATKKKSYFQNKNGTTSYPLTTQVLNVSSWTPEVVSERQEMLLDLFVEKWDLAVSPTKITDENDKVLFHLAIRGCNATGCAGNDGSFIVKAGSKISEDFTPSCPRNYMDKRNKLISAGVIVNGKFVQDYAFDSVSTAASVVGGRSANGRREWTTLDGRQYGKIVGR
jgi:hypothetical protein